MRELNTIEMEETVAAWGPPCGAALIITVVAPFMDGFIEGATEE